MEWQKLKIDAINFAKNHKSRESCFNIIYIYRDGVCGMIESGKYRSGAINLGKDSSDGLEWVDGFFKEYFNSPKLNRDVENYMQLSQLIEDKAYDFENNNTDSEGFGIGMITEIRLLLKGIYNELGNS